MAITACPWEQMIKSVCCFRGATDSERVTVNQHRNQLKTWLCSFIYGLKVRRVVATIPWENEDIAFPEFCDIYSGKILAIKEEDEIEGDVDSQVNPLVN